MTRKRFEEAQEPIRAPAIDPKRCAWKTDGRRCLLSGGMSPYIGENIVLYCHWHYLMLLHPPEQNTFEEFERWNSSWSGYCSVENHYPLSIVWDGTQGILTVGARPHPCKNLLCKYRDFSRSEDRSEAESYIRQYRAVGEEKPLNRRFIPRRWKREPLKVVGHTPNGDEIVIPERLLAKDAVPF